MRTIILFVFFAATLSACSVEEKIHFNSDFSGSFEYKLDVSAIKGLMVNEQDTTDNQTIPLDTLVEIKVFNSMTSIPGITDFKFLEDKETGIISCNFNFKDLATLNTAFNKNYYISGYESDSFFTFFRYENKIFSLVAPPSPDPELNLGGLATDAFTFKLTLEFSKPVKAFNNIKYKLSDDKKSVTQEGKLADIKSRPSMIEVKVK